MNIRFASFSKQITRLCTATAVSASVLSTSVIAADESGKDFFNMELEQLLEVTITSLAKHPQLLSNAAAAVYVITQKDIQTSGVTSIAAALAMVPGIQVAQISSGKWSVSSRGFAGYTSNKLLVLMDGRSVYSPTYSGVFWDDQNTLLEDIDRIEVIRGPGGTIWGANAVNGVVNIITKEAADTRGTLVRFGAGTHERANAAVRQGWKISDSTAGRVYINAADRSENVLEGSDDSSAEDGWLQTQAGFRFDGHAGDKNKWTVQGDIYKNTGDQIIFPYWSPAPPYMVSNSTSIDSSGFNVLTRFQHDFQDDTRFSAQMYYDYNEKDEDFLDILFRTFDAELQYETRVADYHFLTIGSNLRRIDGDDVSNFHICLPTIENHFYSIFLQDRIPLLDDTLILSFGAKWEHNDYTDIEWQPSGKILWKPLPNHSLWGSVSRAVHVPSVNERKGRVIVSSYPPPLGYGIVTLAGDDDFDSETAIAYEAGYRFQSHNSFALDLALFHNEYSRIYTLLPEPVKDGLDMVYTNYTDGYGQGIEMSADWRPVPPLQLNLTYSYLYSFFDWNQSTKRANAINSFKKFIEHLTPRHQVSLRSTYKLSETVRLGGWLRYVDEIKCRNSLQLLQEKTTIDDYFTLDLNMSWKPRKGLEISIAGQNLLNSSQLQYISELNTPPTEIERGVYGKVTWNF